MPDYNNLNYPGSSGYGILPGGGYGLLVTSPKQPVAPPDYPVYDITRGGLVSLKTKQPWTGPLPSGWSDPSRAGAVPTGPVQVPYQPPGTTINPNDPSQRYKPVNIDKSPDIAAGEQDLMKTFQDAASSSLKDFSSYLSNFKTDISGARAASAAATDIGPTVAQLQTGQAKYATGLSADQAALQDLLAKNAAAEQGIVTQVQNTLPQYDAAAQAVADQQFAAVQRNLAKYKMGTGTPGSVGTDEMRVLADAAARVYAPFEQAKIAEQQQILTGLALPVQQDITNRMTSALTQFNPQAQAAIWSSGRATTQDVQNLRQAVAGMSYQQALQFMQALGVPAGVQQAILSGQIGQLGQLSAIEQGAKYQGLQDILGVVPSQPVGYSVAQPGLPNYPPQYYPQAGAPGGSPLNVPATASPVSTPLPVSALPPGTNAWNNPALQSNLTNYLRSLPMGPNLPATGLNLPSYAGGAAEGTLVAG
jgi:hypothetical protein